MRYVTLVNRTSGVLEGTWDGKRHKIHPGKNEFPEIMAHKFKEQHPIMGSEDPYTLDKEYLLGIVEDSDPITPIEQSKAVELVNRKKLGGRAAKAEVIETSAGGLYSHERHAGIPVNGPVETGFTKA